MRTRLASGFALLLFVLLAAACSSPVSQDKDTTDTPATATQPEPPLATATPRSAPTASTLPSPTLTAEPSVTLTVASSASPDLLALEVVEWAQYPYANPADPQNTDTHLEILVRNPNEFPVRINRDGVELRLLNAAGETVYTNPNPFFYIWEGSWIQGSETTSISACVCFATDGVPKQDWDSLELVVPLQPETDVAYTHDVDVTLGEFFSLSEAHLGGDELGAEITLTNTSGQALKSFQVRVIARDAGGKYVGVAVYGGFNNVDDYRNELNFDPGMSGGGVVVSEIDYVDVPLVYEVFAIGILAK